MPGFKFLQYVIVVIFSCSLMIHSNIISVSDTLFLYSDYYLNFVTVLSIVIGFTLLLSSVILDRENIINLRNRVLMSEELDGLSAHLSFGTYLILAYFTGFIYLFLSLLVTYTCILYLYYW